MPAVVNKTELSIGKSEEEGTIKCSLFQKKQETFVLVLLIA